MRHLIAAAVTALATLAIAGTPQAASCDARELVAEVPYFQQSMTPAAVDGSTLEHKDDARITASFDTSAPVGLGQITRTQYVTSLQERGNAASQRVREGGGWGIPAVFPFDPVTYHFTYANPAEVDGRLLAQVEIHVSADCLLTASLSAPDSIALRNRWNALLVAVDALRDNTARFGAPIAFAPESSAPTGAKAYAVELAAPLAVAALLVFLLWRVLGYTPPGAPARFFLTLSAVAAVSTLGANAVGYGVLKLTPQSSMLLAFAASSAMAGAALPWSIMSMAGAGISIASGIALGAFAVVGWGSGLLPGTAAILASGVLAVATWGIDGFRLRA